MKCCCYTLSRTFSGAGWYLATVFRHQQQQGPASIPRCSRYSAHSDIAHSDIAWWDPPTDGQKGSKPQSFGRKGPGKQSCLWQNLGERCGLGPGHREWRSREWTRAEDRGWVCNCWSRRTDWVPGWRHFHLSRAFALAPTSKARIHPRSLKAPSNGEQSHYTEPLPTGPTGLFRNTSLTAAYFMDYKELHRLTSRG